MNRGLLRSTAAASVLTALGSLPRGEPARSDARRTTRVCPRCGTVCGVAVARRDGTVLSVEPEATAAGTGGACPRAFLVPRGLAGAEPLQGAAARPRAATAVAGVVLVTRPGTGPRVAARLATAAGLTLAGGDGDARVGAVWEAEGADAFAVLCERLLASDPDVVGVHATFVGETAE